MFRESRLAVAQDLLEPPAVVVVKCGAVACANADAQEVEWAVEIGFPVEGECLSLCEATKVARPLLVVRCWSNKVRGTVLVARAGEHGRLVKPLRGQRAPLACFAACCSADNPVNTLFMLLVATTVAASATITASSTVTTGLIYNRNITQRYGTVEKI